VGCAGNPWRAYRCYTAQPKLDRPTSLLEDCILSACAEDCRAGQSFDCVGRHRPPRPGSDERAVNTWHVIPGLVTGGPEAEGLRVRLCRREDLECADPEAEESTDANGTVEIEYPPPRGVAGVLVAFDGYIEVSDPMAPPRFLPAIALTKGSFANSTAPEWPLELVVLAQSDLDVLEAVTETPIDVAAGVVIVSAYDCRASDRLRAVCVSYELAPAEEERRWLYGLNREALCTVSDPLLSGSAFAFPVEPGVGALSALYDGAPVSGLDRVPVRPGTVTEALLFPE
jgi:hypothetical protein